VSTDLPLAVAGNYWNRGRRGRAGSRSGADSPDLNELASETKGEAMRRLLTMISLLAALAVPATAAAAEPARETLQITTVTPVPCASGVTLIGVFDVTREITTFYDNDGTAVRQLWVASFEGTTTNPQTSQSLPNRGIRVFHRDLVTGEFFTTGTNVLTKLPDGGVAIGGAGRLVFDSAGHLVEHNGPETSEERAQLCAALGA
jgi:hypothetical protein